MNLRGFFRALLSNFATDGPTQGASTITQQVVKNMFGSVSKTLDNECTVTAGAALYAS